MEYAQKLLVIRKSERLTQMGFSKLCGVSLGGIKNYESGHTEVGLSIITRVLSVPQFAKYTVWLMTGHTDIPQISPNTEYFETVVKAINNR